MMWPFDQSFPFSKSEVLSRHLENERKQNALEEFIKLGEIQTELRRRRCVEMTVTVRTCFGLFSWVTSHSDNWDGYIYGQRKLMGRLYFILTRPELGFNITSELTDRGRENLDEWLKPDEDPFSKFEE